MANSSKRQLSFGVLLKINVKKDAEMSGNYSFKKSGPGMRVYLC